MLFHMFNLLSITYLIIACLRSGLDLCSCFNNKSRS